MPRRDRRAGRALPPHAGRGARREPDDGLRVHRRGRASGSRSCSPGFPRTRRCPTRSTPRRRSPTPRATGTSGRTPAGTTAHYHEEIHAVAPAAQGAHLRADRRHRGRADDLAAGVDRRRPQLGLPLLLAARRDPDAAGDAQAGYSDEADRLARVAAAGGRRRPGRRPDHVRRSPASGASTSASSTGCPGYAGSRPVRIGQRRLGSSSSSTSTASVLDAALPGAGARRHRPTTTAGRWRATCSRGSRTAGGTRTPGSGRCAARRATSPTRR